MPIIKKTLPETAFLVSAGRAKGIVAVGYLFSEWLLLADENIPGDFKLLMLLWPRHCY
jgi:hypothetical protein